jgi:hypothetical protein
MIVSHRYRFIFLTTRKTGGARIEAALARFCADGDIITGATRSNGATEVRAPVVDDGAIALARYRATDWLRLVVRGERARLDKHLGAAAIRGVVGESVWAGYFKFCVERDPWEKAVALYGQRTRGMEPRPTLAAFLTEARPESLSNFALYSIDGSLAVDRVIRHEHLDAELEAVGHLLGLSGSIALPATTQRTAHYSALIGPTERALIDAACAREIDLFGYAFREVAPEDR